jgi:hypothetical protein
MAVLPNSFHGSTTFASKVTSYDLLSERVKRALGYPLVEVEISDEQMYTNIDIACEFFTKFAGVTEEFLIFRSDLYIKGAGLPIGRLLNITPELTSIPNPDYPDHRPLILTEFEADIGNGIDRQFVINHGLNDDNILIQLYDNASDDMVFAQVRSDTLNSIRVTFTTPISSNAVKALIFNGTSKYVEILNGNGQQSEYIINHNLRDENVMIQAYQEATDAQVFVATRSNGLNSSIITFNGNLNSPIRIVVLAGVARLRYISFIGSSTQKEYTITHNLSSDDVLVQVMDADTLEIVYPEISNVSLTQTVISFEPAPISKLYKVIIMKGDETNPTLLSGAWDFDLNSYRKVVDVYSFSEGNNSGINALFTIEHTIAQQAYFGHLLGNVGYDLITWQALKGWLDLREKVLGLMPYLRFNPDTQMLKIVPEPTSSSVYYGLIGCKVQKPIKDIVSQLWIYRYVLALAKITIGHVRGKYTGTNLFGGQQVNYADMMSQGLAEKEKLETEIISDLIDRDPIKFFIG